MTAGLDSLLEGRQTPSARSQVDIVDSELEGYSFG